MKEIYRLIGENPGRIIITAHKNPDGDAVGSTLGLYHFLLNNGYHPYVILPDGFPAFLSWMPDADKIILFENQKEKATELFKNASLIFCLDYNRLDRTGEMEKPIAESQAKKVMIDHHPQPSGQMDVIYSDTSASSTSEMVFRLIEANEAKEKINIACATCLYSGIMTDSGSFRFPSTTPATHRAIAELMEKGADHAAIHTNVYDTSTEDRLRLTGFAITEKMKVLKDLKTAYFVLTKEELQRYNYQKGDTEGLVNYGLSINGILVSAIFVEHKDIIKVSFRSKEKVAVNEFSSAFFNGGGHLNAAGGRSNDSLENTIKKFLEEIPGFMKKYV